ncbi:TPA: hypothetical protein ACH3X2_005537 [Trebouxia sp. C0005]
MQSAQSRPEGSQLLVDSIPQSDEKAQSRSQQTDAAAPSRKAAAQFLANWRVFPKSLVAVMLIWIFSWLYFGTAWGIEGRTHNLHAAVINCDRGYPTASLSQVQAAGLPPTPLGTTLLSQSIWNPASQASQSLQWHNLTCSNSHIQDTFQGLGTATPYGCDTSIELTCIADLMYHVKHDNNYWAALYVPGNFSATFVEAFGNASDVGAEYQQMTIDYMYTQGRGYTSSAAITTVITAIITALSQNLAYQVAGSSSQANVSPDFYIQPIKLLNFNLAPVHTLGQNLATYLVCVLIWLGATFIVASMYPFGTQTEEAVVANILAKGATTGERKQAIYLVLAKGLVAYLFTLLLCALLIVTVVVEGASARGVQDSAQFDGHGVGYAIAFAWYLSLSFIALDSILINLVGPTMFSTLSAFLLILQLTSSGGIIAHELEQPWFRIGVALPFYYGTNGFKTIFFGAGQVPCNGHCHGVSIVARFWCLAKSMVPNPSLTTMIA